MRARRCVMGLAAVVAVAGLAAPAAGADVPQPGVVTHDRIVNADPGPNSPHVLDGQVLAIAEVGSRIILGGDFTQVRNAQGTETLSRPNILAFDKATGLVDTTFAPTVNGPVRALAVAPGSQQVYIAGSFGSVNGTGSSKVALLDTVTGAKITSFKSRNVTGQVEDMKLVAGRLFIGGHFVSVDSVPRTALAELNPATGALLPSVDLDFAGIHWGGDTHVYKMDVTPDGSTMVVIGNFMAVAGAPRVEAAMIDLTTNPATVASWQTDRFVPRCYTVFDFVVRDVDLSPDGSYFVIVTTGGYGGGPPALCDTATRWETAASGPAQNPTWAAYTGGDSTFAVETTGAAVYVGGHQRWQNNPFKADGVGQGSVSREGIAALDPSNGLPFSWNPGRTLGLGVRDLLATEAGLWMGSDTDWAGGELHPRIAYFPLAGGVVHPMQHVRRSPPTSTRLGHARPGQGCCTASTRAALRWRRWTSGRTGRRTRPPPIRSAPAEAAPPRTAPSSRRHRRCR